MDSTICSESYKRKNRGGLKCGFGHYLSLKKGCLDCKRLVGWSLCERVYLKGNKCSKGHYLKSKKRCKECYKKRPIFKVIK